MQINVAALSCWAPGFPDASSWLAWHRGEAQPEGTEPPDLSHIKPMQRRRLSLTARGVFAVGHDCLQGVDEPADVVCIFASAYGPTSLTANMLENIAREEPLSPTSFSLSVHNAISGQFSISHGITAPILALAPGREGIGGVFIEAAGWLSRNPAGKVLVVIYEEPLDERLKPFEEPLPTPMAAAFLLSGDDESGRVSLQMSRSADDQAAETVPFWRQILSTVAFVAGDDDRLEIRSEGACYRWRRGSEN